MYLLAIDASSLPASCALFRDGHLLAEEYIHNRMTHSQTLMPMVQHMLETAALPAPQVDLYTVTVGPGSFTGLRIGIASAKGMAFGSGKPCLPVSTLTALAWNCLSHRGLVYAVMDARCAQVYTAAFRSDGKGGMEPLGEDEAIPLARLQQRIAAAEEPVMLVGDGAELCYRSMEETQNLVLAPAALRFQRASSLGMAALDALAKGAQPIPAEALAPTYLRLPQAERELLQRQAQQTK